MGTAVLARDAGSATVGPAATLFDGLAMTTAAIPALPEEGVHRDLIQGRVPELGNALSGSLSLR